ncbi:MAG: phytanoyl-CoA dioxygenase family protein [Paracoccaceae bacterium]|nr:phytanoyl-CoA dioxygenase family protein [Paracoccaceae bacterium]
MLSELFTQNDIETFEKDGVVLIKNLFADYVDTIRKGIEFNLSNPGKYAAENRFHSENGRFFDDYCNWERIPEFQKAIFKSSVGNVAAQLMKSNNVQLFHEHVLVKEPGTTKPTPWHQDSPYYFIQGSQSVSFWSPMDKVTHASLRCVAGSHKWEKSVLPTKWLNEDNFYEDNQYFMKVPDPEAENMDIREWQMDPGDAVAFDFKILHGARGNTSDQRRRAFSLRLIGDDARFIERPGRTSPPFPNHGMTSGEPLRQDWFPIIFSK